MEENKVQEEQTQEQEPQTAQISQEELNKKQLQMLNWFKSQIAKLQVQAKYEKLRREIAEDRLKEFNYTTTLQMMIAKAQEGLVETPEDLLKAQEEEVPESKLTVSKGKDDE